MSVIKQIPPEAYHADTEWISNSMLKVFRDSRRKFEGQFITKTLPAPRSKSMDIGTVAHAAILEPHIIRDVCRAIPADVLSSNGARSGNKWKEWAEVNAGKILLTANELTTIKGMFKSVYDHPRASQLLQSEGACEQSIFWECLETGLKRRCRVDKLVDGWGFVDVKTTHNVKPFAFSKTCVDYGYHQQAAFYSHGYEAAFGGEAPSHAFIAVETEPPYLVRVYTLPERAVLEGERLIFEGLRQIRDCVDSGDWSDPQEHDVIELELPRYAYFQESQV
jgi:hypothetical protein